MPASAPLFATVIHLSTGHVLAAVTGVGLKPGLDELTAGSHLRVRVDGDRYVDVPRKALEEARVAVDADVLDAPQYYTLAGGQLARGPGPVFGGPPPSGTAGTKAVVVWQDVTGPSWIGRPLGPGGALPASPPPGATGQLLAIEGKPLHVTHLP